jgi:hypothetical protein
VEVIKCIGLGFLERFIREMAWRLNKTFQPKMTKNLVFFAGAYLIVAKKETQDSDIGEKDDITNIKSAYQ